jgi:hypothetical protein
MLGKFISIAAIFILSAAIIHAQVVKKQTEVVTQDESDKCEVKKFVASAIKIFEETNDFEKIPKIFFVTDFKKRFADENVEFGSPSEFLKQLSENERYEHNVVRFNCDYLGLRVMFSNVNSADESDKVSNNDFDRMRFPSSVRRLIKTTKIFPRFIRDGMYDYDEPKSLQEVNILTSEIKSINSAYQKFLTNLSKRKKQQYVKNMKLIRNDISDLFESEICSKDCEGFPDKTQIFHLRYYPFELKLLRQHGNLEIFDFDIYAFS